jgi:uncharacterized membrane protein YphA (DoxX/SURF4 family)
MNSLTRVFLVLLRLAIGWHFLVEGIDKIQSVQLGPTETNRPWTSEPYLREANGPFGDFFRHQIGDPDEATLARLTVAPLPAGADPATMPANTRFPPALARDWDDYYERFVRFYTDPAPLAADWLTPEERVKEDPDKILVEKNNKRKEAIEAAGPEQLRQQAEVKLKQEKDNLVHWLLTGEKKVKKTFPSGTVEVEETMPTRLEEYREQLDRLRAMQDENQRAFGHDVLKDKLRAAKADVARIRNELLRELAEKTTDMKKALDSTLPPALKAVGPVPDLVVKQPGTIIPDRAASFWAWAGAQRSVDWIDFVTRWGLTLVGAGLLLGLFTRTACVGGAAFLLLFYLTMPPFPGLPENLRAEGHYLFVNKNLIEMLALLTLATTRSGRWAGLDGLIYCLNPWRWRRSRQARALRTGHAGPHSPLT